MPLDKRRIFMTCNTFHAFKLFADYLTLYSEYTGCPTKHAHEESEYTGCPTKHAHEESEYTGCPTKHNQKDLDCIIIMYNY